MKILDKILSMLSSEKIALIDFQVESIYKNYKPKNLYPETVQDLRHELNEFYKCFFRTEFFEPDDDKHSFLFEGSEKMMGLGEYTVYQHTSSQFPYMAMRNKIKTLEDNGLLGLLRTICDDFKQRRMEGAVMYAIQKVCNLSSVEERFQLAKQCLGRISSITGDKSSEAQVVSMQHNLEKYILEIAQVMNKHDIQLHIKELENERRKVNG